MRRPWAHRDLEVVDRSCMVLEVWVLGLVCRICQLLRRVRVGRVGLVVQVVQVVSEGMEVEDLVVHMVVRLVQGLVEAEEAVVIAGLQGADLHDVPDAIESGQSTRMCQV